MLESALVTEEVVVIAKSDPIMTETKTGSAQTVATETIRKFYKSAEDSRIFLKTSLLFSGA